MLFRKQPGFCCVCGKPGEYAPHPTRGLICPTGPCHEEYNWRETLYIMGKDYYANPSPRGAD